MYCVAAAVNLADPTVCVHLSNRVFHHVAIATEELQAFVDKFALLLG